MITYELEYRKGDIEKNIEGYRKKPTIKYFKEVIEINRINNYDEIYIDIFDNVLEKNIDGLYHYNYNLDKLTILS